MRFIPGKKALVALGTTAVVTIGAGVAYATWTSPAGTGSGSATGYSALASNITSATANTGNLYPGGSAVTGTVTIHNPNPYAVEVTSIGAGSSVDIPSGFGGTDCPAGAVTSASQSNATGIPQSTAGNPVAIAAGSDGSCSVSYTMQAGGDGNGCE